MLFGGVLSVYYDWYRRITLEAVCQAEEMRDSTIDAHEAMLENPFLRASNK